MAKKLLLVSKLKRELPSLGDMRQVWPPDAHFGMDAASGATTAGEEKTSLACACIEIVV